MAVLSNRKMKMNENRKRHAIRNWLSSLAVTTVVVVATVLSPSSPPSAQFNRIGTFDDSIYYGVTVSDTASTILEETLMIMIESQYDHYEYPLNLGMNTGVVDSLRENTPYLVRVVGSRGYGTETLAQETITTVKRTGGAILSVKLLTEDPSLYELDYQIRTKYNDFDQAFESVHLKYCIEYHDMYQEPLDECIDFTEIELMSTDSSSNIKVPNYNVTIYVELEAVLNAGGVQTLDSYTFKTPLKIDGSLYVYDVSDQSIELSVYVDFSIVEGIQYFIELYDETLLKERKEIIDQPMEIHTDSMTYEFFGLIAETEYRVQLIARYIDPTTSQSKELVIASLEVITAPEYDVSINVTEEIDAYIVEIEIDDPHNILHQFHYVIYDVSGEYPYYVSEYPIDMTLTFDNLKVASFSVIKPIGYDYEIRIVCNKVININTTYYNTPLFIIPKDIH